MILSLTTGSCQPLPISLGHQYNSRCVPLVETSKLLPHCAIFHQWGSNLNLLAANCRKEVQILTKHVMQVHCNQQVPTQLPRCTHQQNAAHTAIHTVGCRHLSVFTIQVSSMQVAPTELLVECHNSSLLHTINTDVHIRGTYVTKVYVLSYTQRVYH